MAVNSVLEGITEYFLKCPLLKDGVFRVDSQELWNIVRHYEKDKSLACGRYFRKNRITQ